MTTRDIFGRIHCKDTAGALRALAESPALAAARHPGLGGTPLHCAAHPGQIDVVAALLAAGADLQARDATSGATPLGWAEHAGHAEVIEFWRGASAR